MLRGPCHRGRLRFVRGSQTTECWWCDCFRGTSAVRLRGGLMCSTSMRTSRSYRRRPFHHRSCTTGSFPSSSTTSGQPRGPRCECGGPRSSRSASPSTSSPWRARRWDRGGEHLARAAQVPGQPRRSASTAMRRPRSCPCTRPGSAPWTEMAPSGGMRLRTGSSRTSPRCCPAATIACS